jgi:hypothetical protein
MLMGSFLKSVQVEWIEKKWKNDGRIKENVKRGRL